MSSRHRFCPVTHTSMRASVRRGRQYQKPGSHCDVAGPREGGKLHVTRRHRVAEAVLHVGVAVSVARERKGSRFVAHCDPRAGQEHLDSVGRNPLLVTRSPLRHNSVNLTPRTRIDVHPLTRDVGVRDPAPTGIDHGPSMPNSGSDLGGVDAAVGTSTLRRVEENERLHARTVAVPVRLQDALAMERPPVPTYAIVCGARGDRHAAGLDLGPAPAAAGATDPTAAGAVAPERAHGGGIVRVSAYLMRGRA